VELQYPLRDTRIFFRVYRWCRSRTRSTTGYGSAKPQRQPTFAEVSLQGSLACLFSRGRRRCANPGLRLLLIIYENLPSFLRAENCSPFHYVFFHCHPTPRNGGELHLRTRKNIFVYAGHASDAALPLRETFCHNAAMTTHRILWASPAANLDRTESLPDSGRQNPRQVPGPHPDEIHRNAFALPPIPIDTTP
jgi:hypothetical protein